MMTIVNNYCCFVILLSTFAGRVISQGENTNTQAYQDYKYQWRNESLVQTCPEGGGAPPFSLGEPIIDARVRGAVLKYTVQVPDPEWVTFQVFDYDCQTEIPTSPEETSIGSTTSSTPTKNSSFPLFGTLDYLYGTTNTASLSLEINPYGLQEYGSVFYTETTRSGQAPAIESSGNVQLCVKVSLWNGFPPSDSRYTSDVLEVTFSETQVTFGARFTVDNAQYLDFSTTGKRMLTTSSNSRTLRSIATSKRNLRTVPTTTSLTDVVDRNRQHLSRHLECSDSWGVQVFTCPTTIDLDFLVESIGQQEQSSSNDPVPGSAVPIRLCIQPNAAAVEAGATVKEVVLLYYDTMSSAPLRQTAVEDGFVSINGLTAMECGAQICSVETTLSREVFLQVQQQDPPQPLIASGRVHFQPSKATLYNQVTVDFALQLEVARGEYSSSNAASSAPVVAPVRSSSFYFILACGAVIGYFAGTVPYSYYLGQ